MLKKVCLFGLTLMLIFSMTAFAAPASLPLNVSSTSTSLVTVTNPTNTSISSYDKVHNISGYAANGVNMAIYVSNGSSYNIMYRNGAPVSWTVGASGMFVQPVALSHGKNTLLIMAEKDGRVQYVNRYITVLSSNIFNLLKNYNF